MTEPIIIPSHQHQSRLGLPSDYPFDDLEHGSIVLLAGRHGLCEVLESADGGQFIFRALNEDGLPLLKASPEDVRSFDLPIFYCFASRHSGEIVAVVSGEHYDVTRNNAPEVAAPLFQQAHAEALVEFMTLALGAGFSNIELANGHEAYEAEIVDLMAECQAFFAD